MGARWFHYIEAVREPAKEQPVMVEFCGGDQSELRVAYAKTLDQPASTRKEPHDNS